ncbi:hypothetical protein [Sphingobium sp. S6]|uniref:hypothetical protein n=1 Tax=Sphingobium sp. S6 TaxID=2758386 RepID=UPI001F288FA8|nr:hypothetical protein [Sphingobium sp. S6]
MLRLVAIDRSAQVDRPAADAAERPGRDRGPESFRAAPVYLPPDQQVRAADMSSARISARYFIPDRAAFGLLRIGLTGWFWREPTQNQPRTTKPMIINDNQVWFCGSVFLPRVYTRAYVCTRAHT